LDQLFDAIIDSKLLGELTYDCGESITVGEGEKFYVRKNSSPPCPKEAIANTDAVKMKSVVFVAPNVDNPRSTIRFLN